MSEFKNVTGIEEGQCVLRWQGREQDRAVPDGSKKTLGIMQAREYEFSTGDKEIMEIWRANWR